MLRAFGMGDISDPRSFRARIVPEAVYEYPDLRLVDQQPLFIHHQVLFGVRDAGSPVELRFSQVNSQVNRAVGTIVHAVSGQSGRATACNEQRVGLSCKFKHVAL